MVRGKVTRAFLQQIGETCDHHGVRHGVVRGVAIPHVMGDPAATPERERSIRRILLEKALEALEQPVSTPTLFQASLTPRRA